MDVANWLNDEFCVRSFLCSSNHETAEARLYGNEKCLEKLVIDPAGGAPLLQFLFP
jgi:hypothetical protein